jgi:hypothetical protein
LLKIGLILINYPYNNRHINIPSSLTQHSIVHLNNRNFIHLSCHVLICLQFHLFYFKNLFNTLVTYICNWQYRIHLIFLLSFSLSATLSHAYLQNLNWAYWCMAKKICFYRNIHVLSYFLTIDDFREEQIPTFFYVCIALYRE